MKKFLFVVLFSNFISVTLASPAQDLFAQARNFLSTNYYGFPAVKLEDALQRGDEKLKAICGSDTKCSFKQARPVIQAVIDELKDPHTYYQIPAENASEQQYQAGQGAIFLRIGISWIYRETSNGWLVLDVMSNAPAKAAGITRGDLIIGIDGVALPKGQELSNKILIETIRSGREFTFTVARGADQRTVKLAGQEIPFPWLPSLYQPSGMSANTFVLSISDFNFPTAAQEIHNLVREAIQKNAKTIILDLRDNLGGFVQQCAAGIGAFLGDTGITIASRREKVTYGYSSDGTIYVDNNGQRSQRGLIRQPVHFTGQVITLVNTATSSCGENFAANLQISQRSIVIGEPTFGILNTGTLTYNLLDGSGLTITAIRILRPNGEIFPVRVTPDISVPDDYDTLEKTARDTMLEKAIQTLNNPTTLEIQSVLPVVLRIWNPRAIVPRAVSIQHN